MTTSSKTIWSYLFIGILTAIATLWTLHLLDFTPLPQAISILNHPAVATLLRNQPIINMSGLKVGDSFPSGVKFSYVPYTPETGDITSCGIPISYDASTEWADKKVVLFSVPGAFTPGCSAKHLPGFIENLPELKKKGVDVVATIAFNDAWVMSAWGKANGIKDDSILFLSDAGTEFSKSIGWTMGERTARYAIVIDHGKVIYAEKEPGREVSVSSAEAVLAKL